MLPKTILGFEQMQNFIVEFQGILVFSLGISRCKTIFQNFKPGMHFSENREGWGYGISRGIEEIASEFPRG